MISADSDGVACHFPSRALERTAVLGRAIKMEITVGVMTWDGCHHYFANSKPPGHNIMLYAHFLSLN